MTPAPRTRPATSVPLGSPRTEENPGYRRGRAIRSCLECRRRKMRCNRSRPCQNCNRFCRDCVYLPFPEWPSGAPSYTKADSNSQSPEQGGGRGLPSFHTHQHTGAVQTSPFTLHDHGYEPDVLVKREGLFDLNVDDESLDVALRIGRLSITETLGQLFKPHIAFQVSISHSTLTILSSLHQGHMESTIGPKLIPVTADYYASISDRSCRGSISPPKRL